MKRTDKTASAGHATWSVRIANGIAATIIVLVPLHAFLTVWVSSFAGHFVLLRLWDELLLAVLCLVVAYWLIVDHTLRQTMLRNRLAQLIAAYGAVTIIWGILGLLRGSVTAEATGYGLIIDLRFVVWFVAVWSLVQRSAWLRNHWKPLVFAPLAIVVVFGVLQFFVWPANILASFGYGRDTFMPFTTINQDSTTLRIQSTLRGANQLGAYLGVLIIVLVAMITSLSRRFLRQWLILAGAIIALVLSFSRSSWLLAVFGGLVVLVTRSKWRLTSQTAAWLAVALIATGGLLILPLKANQNAQNFVLHVSDHSTATQSSNGQHLAALTTGLATIAREPLGQGPGSSGSASWYNSGQPIRNPESFVLQIGEETGWLGLGLFLGILSLVGRELWRRRRDPLALGLFASLIGLVLISVVSYTWADDTLAFIWWGLAAMACAMPWPRHETMHR